MIILCNGMIRAGSTLQFNIVKDMLGKALVRYKAIGFLSDTDILAQKDKIAQYAKEDTIHLIKTHDYSFLNSLDNVYTIYSFRSVLDVAGSVKRKFKRSRKDLYRALEKSALNHTKILNGSSLLLVQEYEKMIQDPLKTVQEIMAFLKMDLDMVKIKEIVEQNSPDSIRKLQNQGDQQKKIKNKLYNFLSHQKGLKDLFKGIFGYKGFKFIKAKMIPHNSSTLLHLDHVSDNLGQNGNWKSILDEEEISYIKKHFPSWEINPIQ